MPFGAKRRRLSLEARLAEAERKEALYRGPLSEDGKLTVDPQTFDLLQRLYELDPALFEAYVRDRYGHIRGPWQKAGDPPPAPEVVRKARNAYSDLWREEHCRRVAEKTGDRLILALWRAYARERDDLEAGKYIHPACVTSHNLWLFDPQWAEKHRSRDVFFWLWPFRRAFEDREWALREEGASPIEDPEEAERLANERAQKIVTSHLLSGRMDCERWGVPFDMPPDGAGYRERG